MTIDKSIKTSITAGFDQLQPTIPMTPKEKMEKLFNDFKIQTVDNNRAFFSEILALMPVLSMDDRKIEVDKIIQYLEAHAEKFPINNGYGKCLITTIHFFKEDYEADPNLYKENFSKATLLDLYRSLMLENK